MTTSLRAKALACTFLAGAALAASPALAQSSPAFRNLDANGVDLTQGDFLTSFSEGSIGSGAASLALLRMVGHYGPTGFSGTSQWDRTLLTVSGSSTYVDWGGRSVKFPGGEARGATISGSGNDYLYTGPDGTVIEFSDPNAGSSDVTNFCDGTQSSCFLIPVSVTAPGGRQLSLTYDFWTNCQTQVHPDDPLSCTYTPRLASVSNSEGYLITFSYASGGSSFSHVNPPSTFSQRTGAAFFNAAVSTTTPQASTSYSYPSSGVTDVTDTGGRVWRVTGNNSASTYYGIRRPGASSDTTGASVSSGQVVSSVTREGVTTSYSRSVSGTTATETVTNALSQTMSVVSDLTAGRPTSVTDGLSHTTAFTYDTSNRLKRITAPEGNYVTLQYDTRGNVNTATYTPKPTSSLNPIVTSASYDTTCTNPVTCNSPNSMTDARGNTTDYTYDPTHGGVLTATAPAPTTGATRQQTRYSYTLTNGEYRLTGLSACRTGGSCVGTADEVTATLGYDPNGNLTSRTVAAGDSSISAATTMTYDSIGNLQTIDGPLSGTADTTRYRYDAARELVGMVSPDPDGAGALKSRAIRNTYTNGLLTKVEQGTVDSQSDSDWAAFHSLQEADTSYDANARSVTQSLVSGGTAYSLTQMSYDLLGRPVCTAVRMSPTYFGSLPSDACTLGTEQSSPSDFGTDRITVTSYDAANRVTAVTGAYGTAAQSDDGRYTYTDNGQVHTALDAENNKTTYVRDGFDRVVQAFLPSPSKGANASSTADYEQYSYDENGNVKTRWQRDGLPIGFTWDALNRVTYKDLPGSDPDTNFSYDLLGHLMGTTQGAETASFTYDALGRKLSETGFLGTMQSQWDAAGRRVRLTWPDGTYVDYDHLVTGEISAVRQNGATSGAGVLATYGYDDLGRRLSMLRGNGTTTGYGYDAVSRVNHIAHDLAGLDYDVGIDLTYNPAGQIVTHSLSNNAYAYTAMGSGTLYYGINGLNQMTAVGSASISFDLRGNMLGDGTNSYTFSSDNRAITASTPPWGAVALGYDPLGRWTRAANYMWLAWDGDDMVIEKINAGSAKWVHGAGGEPLVREDPDGTWHWMHADERGSVIAGSLPDGSLDYNTLRYDEYGRYQGNGYAYGYAGQVAIGDGLAFFGHRLYNWNVGRFVQTDPIGYGDGMNMYNYVHSDPVNHADPTGLDEDGAICGGDCTPVVITKFYNFINGDAAALFPRGGNVSFGATGGTPNGAAAAPAVTPTCQAIHDRANQGKSSLPSYDTETDRWGNVSTLKAELAEAHMNQSEAATAAEIFGGFLEGVGTNSGLQYIAKRGLMSAGRATLIGVGLQAYGFIAGKEAQFYQKQVDAIQARLAEIQAEKDGTCP